MATNYWSKVLRSRVSRRRALASTGATALGAAFLAACGDDDSGGSTVSPTPSNGATGSTGATAGTGSTGGTGTTTLVHVPSDETADGESGGIFPHNHGDLEFTIDPISLIAPTSFAMALPVYSTWVKFGKTVPPERPTPAMIDGDAMQSWEFAPDGLSVTYKLRPDQKFDPRPPTNNRVMTVEDVKWSFDRTEELSPLGGVVFRSAGESGVIDNLEVIDDETIKINLAEPYGAINEILAYGYLYVAPIEGDDQIDLRSEMRGSGPFRLDELQEGIVARFSKNPDWYESGKPFLDGMEYRFIGEQSVLDSQFIAKQLWQTSADTLPNEILRMKDEHPELLMQQDMPRLSPGGYPMNLGTALMDDERMRRAASMVIDRDEMIIAVYGTSTWTDQGLEVPLIWDGHLSSNAASWIDPKTDELGEGAKWFQYNPEEARKLLDAAGYSNEQLDFIRRAGFGPTNLADVISEMLRAGGFNINDIAVEANEWRDMKFAGPTAYNGFFWHTANAFNDDGYLLVKYTEAGRDRAIESNVPGISDQILALRQEFDQDKKSQMLKDVQVALADYMPDVPIVSTQPTRGFTLRWPWLRNTAWAVPGFNQTTSSARQYTDYFIDKALMEQYGG